MIERAREVLTYHEQSEHRLTDRITPSVEPSAPMQFTLFTGADQAIAERISRINLDELKPIDALNLLADLKRQVEEE